MTADIRTAAEREAEGRYQEPMLGCRQLAAAHVEGAVWAAARVTPTREALAETVAQFFGPYDTPEDVATAVLKLMAGLAEGEK